MTYGVPREIILAQDVYDKMDFGVRVPVFGSLW